jgi:hypothetical protein
VVQKENKLEYHIPAEFTSSRPAVNFTHVTHDMPISAHVLGAQLPRATSSISLSSDTAKFHSLVLSPDGPTKLDHWIYQDRGQFHLHIVSFTDATIVTLTWLHTLLDAMGRNAVLRAWTASLEGRDIPEFYGYDVNPLAKFAESASSYEGEEKFILEGRLLSGWALARFGIGYLWNIFYRRAEMARTICIPASTFKRIRQSCLRDLESVDPSILTIDETSKSKPTPFLSDGDILAAWFTRLQICGHPWSRTASPQTTITTMNVLGLRDLLTNTEPQILPKGVAYIGNCVSAIISFFTLHEILSLPLGHLAARIRKDLILQSTRTQQAFCVHTNAKALKETGMNILFGDSTMALIPFSNWAKAKLFETDFSAAVLGGLEEKRKSRGRPIMIMPSGIATGMLSTRNAANVTGRDWDGNYWLSTCLTPDVWAEVEKAIRSMD